VFSKRRVMWKTQDVCVKLESLLFEKERPGKVFKTEVCPKRTLQKGNKKFVTQTFVVFIDLVLLRRWNQEGWI
jgi:hypothetical protein